MEFDTLGGKYIYWSIESYTTTFAHKCWQFFTKSRWIGSFWYFSSSFGEWKMVNQDIEYDPSMTSLFVDAGIPKWKDFNDLTFDKVSKPATSWSKSSLLSGFFNQKYTWWTNIFSFYCRLWYPKILKEKMAEVVSKIQFYWIIVCSWWSVVKILNFERWFFTIVLVLIWS